ncbi:hypothetical protein SFC82_14435 [Legionella pneumophila]|nr:hypothetical protein [Legionella pneumophila]
MEDESKVKKGLKEEKVRIPEDLITNSGCHLITDSGVFDHFNASRRGLSFKGV